MDKRPEISDDTELINRVAGGDEAAFETLFNQYWDAIYSFALLLTKSPDAAQDVGQDVFLAIFSQRRTLSEVTNFRAYLFQVAKFQVLARLRRLKVETAYKDYISGRLQPEHLSADALICEKNLHEAVTQGIALLPHQQRTAFELSRMQGMTHEQISIAMGISKKTVKDYIVRAIAFLRKHLHEHGFLMTSAAAGLVAIPG